MNLTWHIIKKDLIYFRWTLLVWALSLGYLFGHAKVGPSSPANLRDFLQVAAMLLLVVSGFALIAGIIQADHPTAHDVHWRTRPVSAGRLMTAKLLLIGVIFIVAPVIAVSVIHLFDRGHSLHDVSEYGLVSLVLAAIVFSMAAVAACTRNVVHCLVLWLGLLFFVGTMAEFLDRYAPLLNRQALAHLSLTKVLVTLGFGTLIALGVLANQYLRRQLTASVILLVFGAVGASVIGTAWSYFYLYSSQ